MDRIMVPLDGSRFAELALPLALSIAERAGAELDLVTVEDAETPIGLTEPGWQEGAELSPQAAEWAHEYLETLAGRIGEARSGVATRTHVLSGRVAETLDRHGRSENVDLAVLTTHGRGPLSRVWLGSVADALVRRASFPVLLVRTDDEREADLAERVGVSRVLVPLDGSEGAESAVPLARRVADLTGAGIDLLRVVQLPIEVGSPYIPHAAEQTRTALEEKTAEAEQYLAGVVERVAAGGADVRAVVVSDAQPAGGIMKYARKRGVDLIVMNTHGRGGVPRMLLGSVADKVIRSGDVPVLLNRRSPPDGE